MLFNLANLPYWVFLGAGVLLFLVVIFSGGGDDDVDAGVDTDSDLGFDADLEADLDASLDANVDGNSGFEVDLDGHGDSFTVGQVLAWFGLGRAPLLLLLAIDLSLWGLLGWMLTVAIGTLSGGAPQGLMAGGILALSGVLALGAGSFIARPVGKIFAAFSEDASDDRLIGCSGTVGSAFVPFQSSGKIGQVDLLDAAKNRVSVSAVLPDWATITLRRGAKVIAIERTPKAYLVIAQDSPDQQRWLGGNGG